MLKETADFINWTDPMVISDIYSDCFHPVADCDSEGTLNVLWLQNNPDSTVSLLYGRLNEDGFSYFITDTKDQLTDITIANHLLYENSVLYFGYQFGEDSLIFFSTEDYFLSKDTLFTASGSQPGITINAYYEGGIDFNFIRIVLRDTSLNILEWEKEEGGEWYDDRRILRKGRVDYLCVDDIMPPLGYSYLFMKNDSLFHGFSMGVAYMTDIILDTVSTSPSYPSMAYKKFSSEYIDFVWMQESAASYNIHYKRDDKYGYIKSVEDKPKNGIRITGYPNPFTDFLKIIIEAESNIKPSIDIYDVNSRLIQSLMPEGFSENKYYFTVVSGKNL